MLYSNDSDAESESENSLDLDHDQSIYGYFLRVVDAKSPALVEDGILVRA